MTTDNSVDEVSADRPTEWIPLLKARAKLYWLWLPTAGFGILLLSVQCLLGKYPGHEQEVWAWYLPTVLPTSLLMVGVMGATAFRGSARVDVQVRRVFFRWTYAAVAFYLFLVLMVPLIEPFAKKRTPTQLMMLSGLWLGPIQGLVCGMLANLFATQEHRKKEDPSPEDGIVAKIIKISASAGSGSVSQDEIERLFASTELTELTREELKNLAVRLDVSPGRSKKDELIAKMKAALLSRIEKNTGDPA